MSSASNDPERIALIALGSNLGDSICLLSDAIELMERFSTKPIIQSSFWRSEPVDCPSGSPEFVNAAVVLTPFSKETPETLLEKLQALEKYFGRRPKTVMNESRVMDLDLIAFGSEIRDTPTLRLPHPRTYQRRFVLAPLAEIVPNFLLPGQNKTISERLLELPKEAGVQRIEP